MGLELEQDLNGFGFQNGLVRIYHQRFNGRLILFINCALKSDSFQN